MQMLISSIIYSSEKPETSIHWKNVHPLKKMDKQKWSIHTMEYFSVIKREQSDDRYCHMNETQKYYAKWKKPHEKRI